MNTLDRARWIDVTARTCGRWFSGWQNVLERSEEMWLVRDVVSGLAWRNLKTREYTGIAEPVMSWQTALRNVNLKDVRRVEDAHSLCLKTGESQAIEIWVRTENRAERVSNLNICSRCHLCQRRCAAILIHSVPLDDDRA